MTKEEFRTAMAHYAGPACRWPQTREYEQRMATEYRAFDPKLADMIESASAKWNEVFEHIKTRAGTTG